MVRFCNPLTGKTLISHLHDFFQSFNYPLNFATDHYDYMGRNAFTTKQAKTDHWPIFRLSLAFQAQ